VTGFRTKLIFEDAGGLPYTLVAPLVYESAELARVLIVPAGFQTDLASIPRGLWNLLPKSGPYDPAAVIHDYLYASAPRLGSLDRAACDRVLREAMAACGVPAWQRWVIYSAVRVGGQRAWDGHRADDARLKV
jgi:hypothetical protein